MVHIGLTENFLIMIDSVGKIKFYHLADQTTIIEYKPDTVMTKVKKSTKKEYGIKASSNYKNIKKDIPQLFWDQDRLHR